MGFEQVVTSIRTWLEDLSSAVDQVNAAATDEIKLVMPRSKDLLVTFQGDEEGKPEQLPAAVLQLDSGSNESSNSFSLFKGTILGTLYLVDDAASVPECRTKMVRWVQAIKDHCLQPTAILGSYSRINLRGLSFSMGKDAGDVNTLVIRADLTIPTTF